MKDYSEDEQMFNAYIKENVADGRLSDGIDQHTPKLKRRGDPNKRLSYASYFEENDTIEVTPGTKMDYPGKGEVNIVDVDEKSQTATVELMDETREFNVPWDLLQTL